MKNKLKYGMHKLSNLNYPAYSLETGKFYSLHSVY